MARALPITRWVTLCLPFWFLLTLVPLAHAQSKRSTTFKLSGQVVNAMSTHRAVVFAHGVYTLADGTKHHFMTDEHGNFSLTADKRFRAITIKADQYKTMTVQAADSSYLTLRLVRHAPIWTIQETPINAEALVKRMRKQRNQNDAERIGNYKCQVYHKLTVRTDSLQAVKSLLNAGLRIFGQPLLDTKAPAHHLFLTETVADKYYVQDNKQKELIKGLRISGIQQFGGNLPLQQLTNLSIYQDYVTISGSDYVSPMTGRPLSRYHFMAVDTIPTRKGDADSLIVLRFYPKNTRQVNTLKGYLWVHVTSAAVQHTLLLPAINPDDNNYLVQSYALTAEGRWAPDRYEGNFFKPNAIGNVPVEVVQTGIISNFSSLRDWPEKISIAGHAGLLPLESNGIIQEALNGASARDSIFWIGNRPLGLSPEESNTYKFYASAGSLKSVDRLLNLGERLYYGQLAYGPWSLELNKIVYANPYEALRLGLGVNREWLNNTVTTSAYAGYGFQDQRMKWGAGLQWVLDSATNAHVGYQWMDDLVEPGQQRFVQDQYMYSSEKLRKYLISRFDREQRHEAWLATSLWPAFTVRTGYAWRYIQPLYAYSFSRLPDEQLSVFTTQEWSAGFHWGVGEHFIKVKRKLVSLGSRYPSLSINFTAGIPTLSGSRLAYNRLDARINYSIQKPGWGKTGVQLTGGHITGSAPASLLWTGKASFYDASAVVANSFETMRFNEFLLNSYAGLFMNHDFEPFEIQGFPYYPYLSLSHNIGWGTLGNREQHTGINTQDMRHVYFESGVFMSDMFVFYLGGLRTGLGLGAFTRYGAHARPSTWDNFVIKFAARFGV